jgi:hypothetical protein
MQFGIFASDGNGSSQRAVEAAAKNMRPPLTEMGVLDALDRLSQFRGLGLAATVARLEQSASTKTNQTIRALLGQESVNQELLQAAVRVKRAAAQIDEVVHAVGMLLCLPELLEEGEVIEAVSLAAGNTGKSFDLVTDARIAEFTFIDWKGGSESIRKQKLFKDFYILAEADTAKRRYLYFLGDKHAPNVFKSRSPCKGMLRKFAGLQQKFVNRYGPTMLVRDFYEEKRDVVALRNLERDAPAATRAFERMLASHE